MATIQSIFPTHSGQYQKDLWHAANVHLLLAGKFWSSGLVRPLSSARVYRTCSMCCACRDRDNFVAPVQISATRAAPGRTSWIQSSSNKHISACLRTSGRGTTRAWKDPANPHWLSMMRECERLWMHFQAVIASHSVSLMSPSCSQITSPRQSSSRTNSEALPCSGACTLAHTMLSWLMTQLWGWSQLCLHSFRFVLHIMHCCSDAVRPQVMVHLSQMCSIHDLHLCALSAWRQAHACSTCIDNRLLCQINPRHSIAWAINTHSVYSMMRFYADGAKGALSGRSVAHHCSQQLNDVLER